MLLLLFDIFASDPDPVFAIIDIETCGSSFQFKKGRIIEICILIHDGLSVTDRFSTLMDPECYISPMYTNISGITNEMVQGQPKFHEIAKEIIRLTEGHIFVAHNVNFDYGFIKDEFASIGYKYKRDTLCTVRLSRKLLPGRMSYSLGNLCTSLGIDNSARHRAEGDATATAQLFDILLQQKNLHPQYKNMGVDEIMTRRIDKIKKYILNKLPEECGVYYFFDQEGNILYIGKSKNMYTRALSHFNNDEKKARKMLNDLFNVDFICTGSELIALLLEAQEIKKYKPPYNRQSKEDNFLYSIDCFKDEQGILNLALVDYNEAQNPIASFLKYFTARERLETLTQQYELCLQYTGLSEKNNSPCFNHQIKICHGICCEDELVANYNKRVEKLLKENGYTKESYVIIDQGRNADERSLIWIEAGKYYGYGYMDNTEPVYSMEELRSYIIAANYHPDSDQLIKSWRRKNPKCVVLNKGKASFTGSY